MIVQLTFDFRSPDSSLKYLPDYIHKRHFIALLLRPSSNPVHIKKANPLLMDLPTYHPLLTIYPLQHTHLLEALYLQADHISQISTCRLIEAVFASAQDSRKPQAIPDSNFPKELNS